ncbi:MAG: hypothetical protein R3225_01045 [Halofilum sp. (in: g-proteobacteria)]|nr:hypothetical protein [Halofilum sp. (in: g-proteobacteria)]
MPRSEREWLQSALAGRYEPGVRATDAAPGLSLREIVDWDLVQLAAWRGRDDELAGHIGSVLGTARPAPCTGVDADGLELLAVAPLRLWCVAPAGDPRLARLADSLDAAVGCVTPLGHSHARVRIGGPAARALLAQEIAIDLDPAACASGRIARTALHHVPVLLQCRDAAAGVFDLYLPRSFAASSWEYLLDLAEAHGYKLHPRAGPDSMA